MIQETSTYKHFDTKDELRNAVRLEFSGEDGLQMETSLLSWTKNDQSTCFKIGNQDRSFEITVGEKSRSGTSDFLDSYFYKVSRLSWWYTRLDRAYYYSIFIPNFELMNWGLAPRIVGEPPLEYKVGEIELIAEQFRVVGETYIVLTCITPVDYPTLLKHSQIFFDMISFLYGTKIFHWFCFFHRNIALDSISGMVYERWHDYRVNLFPAFGAFGVMGQFVGEDTSLSADQFSTLGQMAISDFRIADLLLMINEISTVSPRPHCMLLAKLIDCLFSIIEGKQEGQPAYQATSSYGLGDIDRRWPRALVNLEIGFNQEEATALLWAFSSARKADFFDKEGPAVNYKRLQGVLANILNTLLLRMLDYKGFMADQTIDREAHLWSKTIDEVICRQI
jgi:hypothetical protein